MIGTRKGAFLAFSDVGRCKWQLRGPYMKGLEVDHLIALPTIADNPPVIYGAARSASWGPGIQRSTDLGDSWSELPEPLRFRRHRGLTVQRIWTLHGDLRGETLILYAGVDPGALFRVNDDGQHWEEIRSLTDHPTRDSWTRGGGGLMVHSLCADPHRPERMYVGISAAGVFRTDDGGLTWSPKNKGVPADFLPDRFPLVGQCVHHLELHTQNPQILYQQNHCGVYRSDSAGEDWVDVSDGLPSRFGFALAVHPHDGDCLFVIPEESSTFRATSDGTFRVYRSRDRGASWEALTRGLPQANAHVNVLRHGMATDRLEPAGIYIGTQGGQLLFSREGDDEWEVLFNWLPPIYSVTTASLQ